MLVWPTCYSLLHVGGSWYTNFRPGILPNPQPGTPRGRGSNPPASLHGAGRGAGGTNDQRKIIEGFTEKSRLPHRGGKGVDYGRMVRGAEGGPMTEEEAMTKWCPFARAATNGIGEPGEPVVNRQWLAIEKKGIADAACHCLGSHCMAWRQSMDNGKPYAGRCGLVGS